MPARTLLLALALLALGAAPAAAEKVWSKGHLEIRTAPDADGASLAAVAAHEPLVVLQRLGRWVKVAYHGASGWVLRSEVGEVAAASAPREARSEPHAARKIKQVVGHHRALPAASEENLDEDAVDDAAPAPRHVASLAPARAKSKPTAAKSRPAAAQPTAVAVAEPAPQPTPQPARRRVWGGRGAGGAPLRVEVEAESAAALEEPDADSRSKFTVYGGDELRVVARGKNRWILVENDDGMTGWIPVAAVKDRGEFVAMDRGGAARAEDAARGGARDEIVVDTAAAADADAADDDDALAETPSTARRGRDLLARAPRFVWRSDVSGGYTAAGMTMQITSGQGSSLATYQGKSVEAVGAGAYRVGDGAYLGGRVDYLYVDGSSGLSYRTADVAMKDTGLASNTVDGALTFGWGHDTVLTARAGYHLSQLKVDSLDNMEKFPSSIIRGPLLGVSLTSKLGGRFSAEASADTLISGKHQQTHGLEDGGQVSSVTAAWARVGLAWQLWGGVALSAHYRYSYLQTAWTGDSVRLPGASGAERTDRAHTVLFGLTLVR